MKKCPYCAEDILDDAIKCKHCNEKLSNKDKPTIDLQSSSYAREENITAILPQGDFFIGVKDIPDISAHLPDKFTKFPKGAPPITEARYGVMLGTPYARYSNLYFKGWGVYDLLYTDKRLVLVCAPPKGVDPLLIFGVAGLTISTAYKTYQLSKKTKKINVDHMNTLVENGLAMYTAKELRPEVIIAKEKQSILGLWSQTSSISRVVVKGRFIYQKTELNGFIGFSNAANEKLTRRQIEQTGITAVTVLENKVDTGSDFRVLVNYGRG
jgi:hypothetical protein